MHEKGSRVPCIRACLPACHAAGLYSPWDSLSRQKCACLPFGLLALRASFKLYTFASPYLAQGTVNGTGRYKATFVSRAHGGARPGSRCLTTEPRARVCGRVRPGSRCLTTAPHTLAGSLRRPSLGTLRYLSVHFLRATSLPSTLKRSSAGLFTIGLHFLDPLNCSPQWNAFTLASLPPSDL